jgi:hypothetical protein
MRRALPGGPGEGINRRYAMRPAADAGLWQMALAEATMTEPLRELVSLRGRAGVPQCRARPRLIEDSRWRL